MKEKKNEDENEKRKKNEKKNIKYKTNKNIMIIKYSKNTDKVKK